VYHQPGRDFTERRVPLDQESLNNATAVCRATDKDLATVLAEMGLDSEALLQRLRTFRETLEFEHGRGGINFLKNVIPFNSLTEEQLEEIASSMKWQEFRSRSVIIKQGGAAITFSSCVPVSSKSTSTKTGRKLCSVSWVKATASAKWLC
jgi:hypothetical protein